MTSPSDPNDQGDQWDALLDNRRPAVIRNAPDRCLRNHIGSSCPLVMGDGESATRHEGRKRARVESPLRRRCS